MVRGGFISRNIAGFTGTLESAMLTEELSRVSGLLQRLDPRVKLGTFILFIVVTGLAADFWQLTVMLGLVIAFFLLSRIPMVFFIKRVLVFIPLFTAVIAIPALFITPGETLIHLGAVIITRQGFHTAGMLVLRVADSLSFGILLILTTPWPKLLAAFRWFRLPSILIDIIAMTYRYIFVLLHTVNSMFLARRSRTVNDFSGAEYRRWLARTIGVTLSKSQHLSENVYLAMVSRGYHGEIYTLNRLSAGTYDYVWLVFSVLAAGMILWSTVLIGK